MNLKQNQKGFTIVELLIVIVVIAILAAISIVAYTGIQDRAKASAAESLATNISKKADIFYTLNSNYPATVTAFEAATGEAALDSKSQAALTITTPTDETTVQYQYCDAGDGAQIVWYDATTNGTKTVALGTQTSCAAPAS